MILLGDFNCSFNRFCSGICKKNLFHISSLIELLSSLIELLSSFNCWNIIKEVRGM